MPMVGMRVLTPDAKYLPWITIFSVLALGSGFWRLGADSMMYLSCEGMLRGHWWVAVTHLMTHRDVAHLASNLCVIGLLGVVLELRVSRRLVAFIICGVIVGTVGTSCLWLSADSAIRGSSCIGWGFWGAWSTMQRGLKFKATILLLTVVYVTMPIWWTIPFEYKSLIAWKAHLISWFIGVFLASLLYLRATPLDDCVRTKSNAAQHQ